MTKLGAVFPPAAEQKSISRGSTDMGNVSYAVPSIHPVFDIGGTADIHTEAFREGAKGIEAHERTLRCGKSLAMTAIEICFDRELFARVVAEFKGSK
jgi:hypothetical protein